MPYKNVNSRQSIVFTKCAIEQCQFSELLATKIVLTLRNLNALANDLLDLDNKNKTIMPSIYTAM